MHSAPWMNTSVSMSASLHISRISSSDISLAKTTRDNPASLSRRAPAQRMHGHLCGAMNRHIGSKRLDQAHNTPVLHDKSVYSDTTRQTNGSFRLGKLIVKKKGVKRLIDLNTRALQ